MKPRILFCLLAVAALLPAARAGTYTISGLGFLGTPATGQGYSVAAAINDSGQICGTSDVYDSKHNFVTQQAFLYTGGKMVSLGGLGTGPNGELSSSTATALNNSGQVTGGAEMYNGAHVYRGIRAYLYTNGKMLSLGTPYTDENAIGYSRGLAINDSGQVAGELEAYSRYAGQVYDNGIATFTFSNGSINYIASFGTASFGRGYTSAVAVTEDGHVVANGDDYVNDGGDNGNRYVGHIVGVLAPPSPQYAPSLTLGNFGTAYGPSDLQGYTVATAVNKSGQIVGYSDAYNNDSHFRGQQAFLYTPGAPLDYRGNAILTNLGGFGKSPASSVFSRARAISDSGLVVGDSTVYDAQHVAHGTAAFLYRDGKMQPLGDFGISKEGHVTSTAFAVNDSGDVLGFAKFFTPRHTSPGVHPFLYHHGKLHDLYQLLGNGGGWSDLQPVAINNAGQIIGSGLHNGNREAFVVAPPPL